ncbi:MULTISPECIES: hypothetical protein [unclassified Candidatus Tisiphia]|jgi:hypothetical protein|uniref:hypothetical protein n=1 Tax=unclassified Candidatus Tisiphia TaxID=2996318 RepID=UPI001E6FBA65|nr:hypothetical protein [Rickettsia sp.]UCM92475.1 MAG: hypothetical protein LF884_06445 [Rickettsia endosymbiont of Cimex lectularius]
MLKSVETNNINLTNYLMTKDNVNIKNANTPLSLNTINIHNKYIKVKITTVDLLFSTQKQNRGILNILLTNQQVYISYIIKNKTNSLFKTVSDSLP